MTKDFWINLPVKNISRSKAFFISLGFSPNMAEFDPVHSCGFMIGQKKVPLMLFDEATFKNFTNAPIADAGSAAEVLLSIDAESKEEVDELAAKAAAAGGRTSHIPTAMAGWMYGCVFSDTDGHRWNVLYMDKNKMPGQGSGDRKM